MGFSNFADYKTKVVDGGQSHSSTFRKQSAAVTAAGIWFDGSMSGGHPIANFYASSPVVAANLLGREGIQNGSDQAPAQKYIKRITAMCSVAPTNLLFLDLLLYYPFVDGDTTGPQPLDNTLASLQRYTNGNDVSAFVVAQGAYTGGAQFFITYTNQDGISGRISQLVTCNTAGVAGSVVNSGTAAGNFGWKIPLQHGDTGIRSVQEFEFLTANGGIFALVLAKDIGVVSILEANVPAEKDFLIDTGLNLPPIADGAFLSYLILPSASVANAPIYGSIQTVWG
jgi:hypothetical protein